MKDDKWACSGCGKSEPDVFRKKYLRCNLCVAKNGKIAMAKCYLLKKKVEKEVVNRNAFDTKLSGRYLRIVL